MSRYGTSSQNHKEIYHGAKLIGAVYKQHQQLGGVKNWSNLPTNSAEKLLSSIRKSCQHCLWMVPINLQYCFWLFYQSKLKTKWL